MRSRRQAQGWTLDRLAAAAGVSRRMARFSLTVFEPRVGPAAHRKDFDG